MLLYSLTKSHGCCHHILNKSHFIKSPTVSVPVYKNIILLYSLSLSLSYNFLLWSTPVHKLLHLIIQHQDGCSPCTSKNIRKRPPIKRPNTFSQINRFPTIQSVSIHGSLHTRLHHHPPSYGIHRVWQKTRWRGHPLGCNPALPQRDFAILGHFFFYGIKSTKIDPTVDHHALKGGREAFVDPAGPVFRVHRGEEVADALKLARIDSPEIGCQARVRDVKRVDDH